MNDGTLSLTELGGGEFEISRTLQALADRESISSLISRLTFSTALQSLMEIGEITFPVDDRPAFAFDFDELHGTPAQP